MTGSNINFNSSTIRIYVKLKITKLCGKVFIQCLICLLQNKFFNPVSFGARHAKLAYLRDYLTQIRVFCSYSHYKYVQTI